MSAVEGARVSGGSPASALAVLRLRHGTRGPSIGARAEQIYSGALVGAIALAVAWGVAGDAVEELLTPERWAAWGIPVLAAVLVALARFGVWQGPVGFSPADVALLLSAPVRRAGLVRVQLARVLALGAVAGGGLGVAGLSFTAASDRAPAAQAWGTGIVAAAAFGVLAVAVSWLVESSDLTARIVARAGLLPWLGVAALAVAGGIGGSAREIALYSGPWGWAVAAGDRGGTAGVAGLAATVAFTVLVTAFAWARAGAGTLEGFALRAAARSSVVASATLADFRRVGQARARATRQVAGPRRTPADPPAERPVEGDNRPEVGARRTAIGGPPRTGMPWAIAWRDLLALGRDRTRPVVAAALAVGATLAAAAHPDRASWAGAAAVGAFLAATRLMEPARAEYDAPDRASLLLGHDAREVALAHARVPGALLATASLLALAAGVATDLVDPVPALAAFVLAVTAWAFALLCALGAAAQGGGLPLSLLTMSAADPSGGSGLFLIIGYLVIWPLLTIVFVLAAILVAGAAGSLGGAVVILGVGTLGAYGWLHRPSLTPEEHR